MKNLIKVLLIVELLFSCKGEPKKDIVKPFRGIGEFTIGNDFDKSPSYKLFEITDDNMNTYQYECNDVKTYILKKHELNKKIGFVENLHIVTYKGKIFSVNFFDGKFTNVDEIYNYIINNGAKETSSSNNLESNDSKIEITISYGKYIDNDYPETYHTECSYTDPHIQNVIESIYNRKSIYNDRKSKIKEKEEYLKDLKKL